MADLINKQKLLLMVSSIRSTLEEMSSDLNQITSAAVQKDKGTQITFEQCIPVILKWEGGYVNNPSDPGGETNFGISKASSPNIDIKNLTLTQAIDIYQRDFWDKCQLDKLPAQVRLSFFDACINVGYGRATICLQQALGLFSDGILGPQTIAAANAAGASLVHDFLAKRVEFYMGINTWQFFGAGWMNRILDIAIESGKDMP